MNLGRGKIWKTRRTNSAVNARDGQRRWAARWELMTGFLPIRTYVPVIKRTVSWITRIDHSLTDAAGSGPKTIKAKRPYSMIFFGRLSPAPGSGRGENVLALLTILTFMLFLYPGRSFPKLQEAGELHLQRPFLFIGLDRIRMERYLPILDDRQGVVSDQG